MKELMNYLMNDVLCKASMVYQIAIDNGLENTQDYLHYQDALNCFSVAFSPALNIKNESQIALKSKFQKSDIII
jgi:hypothetical protein